MPLACRAELEKLQYAPLVANKEELTVFKDRGIIKQVRVDGQSQANRIVVPIRSVSKSSVLTRLAFVPLCCDATMFVLPCCSERTRHFSLHRAPDGEFSQVSRPGAARHTAARRVGGM